MAISTFVLSSPWKGVKNPGPEDQVFYVEIKNQRQSAFISVEFFFLSSA